MVFIQGLDQLLRFLPVHGLFRLDQLVVHLLSLWYHLVLIVNASQNLVEMLYKRVLLVAI